MAHDGGCTCGKLRYRMTAEPLIVHVCHCRQCQRLTGSAFVMNAVIEKSTVELLSGTPKACRFEGTSQTAYFCEHCGTYLWSAYSGHFDACWFVRVGTLDEPNLAGVEAPELELDGTAANRWAVGTAGRSVSAGRQ